MLRGRWLLVIALNIHAQIEDRIDYVKNIFFKEL
jgi:hypothetical protein